MNQQLSEEITTQERLLCYIAKQTAFWRKQNISKQEIANIVTFEQAYWIDERSNLEMFNNNMQRS